jgi:hypothetical protein
MPRQKAEHRAHLNKLSDDAIEMRNKEMMDQHSKFLNGSIEAMRKQRELDESLRKSGESFKSFEKMNQELKAGIEDLRRVPQGIPVK